MLLREFADNGSKQIEHYAYLVYGLGKHFFKLRYIVGGLVSYWYYSINRIILSAIWANVTAG